MKLSHYEWDPEKDLIAEGGFAEVFKAKDLNTTNRWVALKIYKEAVSRGTTGTTGQKKYSLEQEFAKIDGISHTNIISYYGLEYLQHKDMMGRISNYPIIIMEYAGEGTLKDLMKKDVSSQETIRIIKSIIEAIGYLHEQGIIHRDLKPGNILFSKDRNEKLIPKVTDFGISRDILSDKTIEQSFTEGIGTSHYMAPEQFYKKKFGLHEEISERTDIWAVGVILYRLLVGKFPFGEGKKDYELIREDIIGKTPDFNEVPVEFRAIVEGCLQKEAKNRIESASTLLKILSGNTDIHIAPQSEEQESPTIYSGNNTNESTVIRSTTSKETNHPIQKEVKKNKKRTYGLVAGIVLLIALGVGGYFINNTIKINNVLEEAWRYYEQGKYKDAYELYLQASDYGSGKADYFISLMAQTGRGVDINYEKTKKYADMAMDGGYEMAAFHYGWLYQYGLGVAIDTVKATSYFKKSLNHTEKLAEKGDSEAQNILGLLYANGYAVTKDLNKSFDLTKKAAEKGHPAAMANLAGKYQYGNGTEKNCEEALKWYEKGIAINHDRASLGLGKIYHYGCEDIETDYDKALKYYKTAAELGSLEAQNTLGLIYDTGRITTRDEDEALWWFRKAAESDYIPSYNNLGAIYYKKKNYPEAKNWFQKAAKKNDYFGQYNLGLIYYFGQGEPKNYEKAREWYGKAANQGYGSGQYMLGKMFENGEGGERDYKKAREWYEKASAQGNEKASYALGSLYYDGRGVSKNYDKAFELYTKAADKRYALAQYMLGLMNEIGRGTSKSYKKAREWYEKAAAQGNAKAQYGLGRFYYYGNTVTVKNAVKAKKWFEKAANQGHASSQYMLGLISYNKKLYYTSKKWFERAAKQKDADAQNYLGILYDQGKVGAVDYNKAFGYFTQAANNGSSVAQYNVGLYYYYGKGRPVNKRVAREWYNKACNNGYDKACAKIKELF